MTYNLTGFNQTTYIGFTQEISNLVNTSYDVSYFAIILGIVFCILFFGLMRRFKPEDSALAASFVSLLVGVMFIFAELLSFNYLWYLLGIFIGSLIVKIFMEYK